jgi:hypothetical protein
MRSHSFRRLGLSIAAVTTVLLPTFIAATPNLAGATTAPDPTIHYPFDGNLNDLGGASTLTTMPTCPTVDGNACNATAAFGNDSNGGFWEWTSTANRGGGFRLLSNQSIGSTYTLTMKFSFDMVGPSWRKIIDFRNRVPDTGFYFINGTIRFYNLGVASTQVYPANTVLDLVAVRQSSGGTAGTFTVYARGTDGILTQLISISDPNGESIPFLNGSSQTLLGFFFDDTATSSEATNGGKVYDIKIWENTALTPEQIENSLNPPAPPTGVVVTPGDQQVTVSWDPVADATEYTASVSPGGQSCTVAAPATTCVITGLTNGVSYLVSVAAVGPGGTSTASAAISSVPVIDPVVPTFTG